jgi:hypothetical protein
VKTFPPRTLSSSAAASPILSFAGPTQPPAPVSHPFATDLSLSTEELQERDNAMRYFYNVRLLKEGVTEGAAAENALTNGHAESEEKWGESVMEVQADKIS